MVNYITYSYQLSIYVCICIGIYLNKYILYTADAKVADVIKKDPDRDCRKYNIKARAREIFTALDVDKNGLVDEDEFIAG